MNRFQTRRPVVFMLVVAAAAILPNPASAGERPFQSRGTAKFVGPTDFVGVGTATHMGRYTEIGFARFSPTADPTVLRIDARNTYTASNGDKLHATLEGFLNAATGAITATVTYTGGSGRFDDAGGSATLTGQIQPNGTIAVIVEGSIDY